VTARTTKRLRAAYGENPGAYTRWARRPPKAPDVGSIVDLAGAPDLLHLFSSGAPRSLRWAHVYAALSWLGLPRFAYALCVLPMDRGSNA
jgi:hypothetical protein